MRLSTLLDMVNLQKQMTEDFSVTGITASSKEVKDGYIFVPLKGEKTDGLDFLSEAIKNGAKAILCDRDIETLIPVIKVDDARSWLAKLAMIIYPHNNITTLAVTGTNGKTSTAFYVYQFLNYMGIKTASIGTLGVYVDDVLEKGTMTTPDSVTLSQMFSKLESKGVKVVVMEASSHGLEQKRLDGFSFYSAGFTNLTRDHLDYHKTMDNYCCAKTYLFENLLNKNKGVSVINSDDAFSDRFITTSNNSGVKLVTYGYNGVDFKIHSITPLPDGQLISFSHNGKLKEVKLNIFGAFQVYNILCAMGLAQSIGIDVEKLIEFLPKLKAPEGRLELVSSFNGGNIFVDYAHTPDALENVLKSLRPHTTGRLITLIGCGGNRDIGKRSLMGEIANNLADVVYITDDNPRFEDAAIIRETIKNSCEKGIVISDRRDAIFHAIKNLKTGDTLVLCGKGHETGQIINGVVYPFNDSAEVLLATHILKSKVIWDTVSLTEVLQTQVPENTFVTGISIDTRTICPGDMFIALKGKKSDGHLFVKMAIEKGASICLVEKEIEGIQQNRQIVVSNTYDALNLLAVYARKRSNAVFVGITGSSGKTTTKEMLKVCLESNGVVGATKGNLNNEIGVPLTLATLPSDAQYAVIELGMNHTGEISKLTHLVQPDISIITMIGTAHQEFFPSRKDIALAKAEIFEGQKKNSIAIINRDSEFFDVLKEKALESDLNIISFGENNDSEFRLLSCDISDKCFVKLKYKENVYDYKINFLGKHFAMNSMAVLAAINGLGLSLKKVLPCLENTQPIKGRGLMEKINISLTKTITLIDDCYNANPSSMQASLNVLGAQSGGRRIAVLADMLELGDQSIQMHKELLSFILENKVDKVYTVGLFMQHLNDVLPTHIRGKHSQTVDELMEIFEGHLMNNDIVLVKGSNGMKLNKLIMMLQKRK